MEAKRVSLPGFRAPSSRFADTARSVLTSTWTLGALVFALTWGGALPEPGARSVDNSLHAGLQLAATNGLNFGSDLVFTYGPLGFLKSYFVFEPWPARLALAYGITLHLALSLTLVWAARRSFGLVAGVAVALVAAALLRGDLALVGVRDDAAVVVLAFVWCVAALRDDAPPWVRRIVIWGGGPFAAIESLAKINTGIIVLALIGLTVLAIEPGRRRNLTILAATFLSSVALLWLATGQALSDVGGFLTGAWEIVSGYSTGARLEWEQRRYDYVLLPIVIVATAAYAWLATREMRRVPRAVVLALFAIVAFTGAKAGLVAHDEYHMATFYATMLGACLAFEIAAATPPRIRAAALGVVAAVAAAGFTTAYLPYYPLINPAENVGNAATTIAAVADPGRLDDEIGARRTKLAGEYDVDPATVRLLRGHGVHPDPGSVQVLWAYGLEWDPIPVFQPYAAWTPELDERNAAAIAAPDGPDRILREDLNVLGRYPAFESPAAMLAMLCHFEAERTTDDWQVLRRVPDRCGEPAPIGTAESSYGEPIPVPEAGPGEVVFARLDGVQVSGLERLRTSLYRAKARAISFDGGRNRPFIPTTASDGLLLRAPPGLDFPEPFALAPNPDDITLYLNGEATDDPITADFFAMRVTPPEGGRR